MSIVINYLDEKIDSVLENASEAKLSKASPNDMISFAERTSDGASKADRVQVLLTRYALIYILLRRGIAVDQKAFVSMIARVQRIQSQSYIVPDVVALMLAARSHILGIGNNQKTAKAFWESLSRSAYAAVKKSSSREERLHLVLKIIILKEIYSKTDKWELQKAFEKETSNTADYIHITVAIAPAAKPDKALLRELFGNDEDSFLELLTQPNKSPLLDWQQQLHQLFEMRLVMPVTHDFIRYHNPTYKTTGDGTKVQNILTNIAKTREFSKAHQWYKKQLYAVLFNHFEELSLVEQGTKGTINKYAAYDEVRSFQLQHHFDFNDASFIMRKPIVALRSASVLNNEVFETRNVNANERVNLMGLVLTHPRMMPLTPKKISEVRADDALAAAERVWRGKESRLCFLQNDEALVEKLYKRALRDRRTREERLLKRCKTVWQRRLVCRSAIDCLKGLSPRPPLPKLPSRQLKDVGDVQRRQGSMRCAHHAQSTDLLTFVQQYAKASDEDYAVCRSCGEVLHGLLGKTFLDEDSGSFVVTQLTTNVNLADQKANFGLETLLQDLDRLLKQRVGRTFKLHALTADNRGGEAKRQRILGDTLELIRATNTTKCGMRELPVDGGILSNPSSFSLFMVYLVFILILDMGETEARSLLPARRSKIPPQIASFVLPDGKRLADLPTLSLLICESNRLLCTFKLYFADDFVATFLALLTVSIQSDHDTHRVISGRFRLKMSLFSKRCLSDEKRQSAPTQKPYAGPEWSWSRHVRRFYVVTPQAALRLPTTSPPRVNPASKASWDSAALRTLVEQSQKHIPPLQLPETPEPRPAPPTSIKVEAVLNTLAHRLSHGFSEEYLLVNNDHTGAQLKTPLKIAVSDAAIEKVDGKACYSVPSADGHTWFYQVDHLNLVAIRQKGKLYKVENQRMNVLVKKMSIKARLLSLLEVAEPDTRELCRLIGQIRCELGVTEIRSHLLGTAKTNLTDADVDRARQLFHEKCKRQNREKAYRILKTIRLKTQSPEIAVHESGDVSAMLAEALHMIESSSLPQETLLDILDKVTDDNDYSDRLYNFVLDSTRMQSLTMLVTKVVTDPEDEREESDEMSLDELTRDIDVEGSLYDNEEE